MIRATLLLNQYNEVNKVINIPTAISLELNILINVMYCAPAVDKCKQPKPLNVKTSNSVLENEQSCRSLSCRGIGVSSN